uniref:Uncharacterized protein n=1 Tax=Cacopsylla melanoneura TaxID=428564 RepID=A0A8D9EH09_9HEMI
MMKDNLVHISLLLLQCSISMSSLLQHGILHYYVLKSWKPTLSSKFQIWSPWSFNDESHSCPFFFIAPACSISMSSLLQHGILHYYVLKSWKPTLSSKVQIWSPWSSYDERQSCKYFSCFIQYSCLQQSTSHATLVS